MRRVRWGLVVLALSLSAAQPAVAAAGVDAETENALAAINDARARAGIAPLALSPALTRSSEAFGGHILRTGVFAHAGTIQAAGGFRRLGECIAMHTGRAARPGWTVRRWLASPGHRALVLSRGFRQAGAAAVQGNFRGRQSTIWVLQLGGR
jgi:uncharacterized protein YkwD